MGYRAVLFKQIPRFARDDNPCWRGPKHLTFALPPFVILRAPPFVILRTPPFVILRTPPFVILS
ncbi:MAG: hypothetical protein ABJA80_04330, partial [bacterium]